MQPSERPSSMISRWIDHIMDSIFFKADHLHFTLAKRNSPSETVVKTTHRQMGTSSTPAETSPTACSLFGAVMRQFEFNSRRIPIEKASPGAAPLDLQMSEKEIRLSGLSLFMAVEAEQVLKTSLDFGLSSSVPSDQLLADPVDVSIALLLPPIMQVVMQPGLRYMAMKKIGLSIRIESDVLATCKSSHIAQLSALLHNMLLYKVCLSVCLSLLSPTMFRPGRHLLSFLSFSTRA